MLKTLKIKIPIVKEARWEFCFAAASKASLSRKKSYMQQGFFEDFLEKMLTRISVYGILMTEGHKIYVLRVKRGLEIRAILHFNT